jgi:hypothetical protein
MRYLTTIIIAAILFFVAWVWIISPLAESVTDKVQSRVNQINTITDKLK